MRHPWCLGRVTIINNGVLHVPGALEYNFLLSFSMGPLGGYYLYLWNMLWGSVIISTD